jgi:hypothetical protein
MRNEFTAIIERDGKWYVAYSPEVPGANGQGRTKAAARKSLAGQLSSSSTISAGCTARLPRSAIRDGNSWVARCALRHLGGTDVTKGGRFPPLDEPAPV